MSELFFIGTWLSLTGTAIVTSIACIHYKLKSKQKIAIEETCTDKKENMDIYLCSVIQNMLSNKKAYILDKRKIGTSEEESGIREITPTAIKMDFTDSNKALEINYLMEVITYSWKIEKSYDIALYRSENVESDFINLFNENTFIFNYNEILFTGTKEELNDLKADIIRDKAIRLIESIEYNEPYKSKKKLRS